MTVEDRINILETTVASLVKEIGKLKAASEQTNASMRQSMENVSPSYKESKIAYIDDTEVIFGGVPSGEVVVSISDPSVAYGMQREDDKIIVTFNPLSEVMEVTLSIH